MSRHKWLSVIVVLALLAVVFPHFLVPQPVMAATTEFYCSMDTRMQEDEPTTNYDGTGLKAGVGGPLGYAERSILQFSINWGVDIPDDATIVEATLTLDSVTSGGNAMTLYAQRLRRLNCSETQATWEVYKTGSSWGVDGAGSSSSDFTYVDEASFYYNGVGLPDVVFDVTDIVERQQSYEDDVAFRVVSDPEEAYAHISFIDSEAGGGQPVLAVQYSYEAESTYPPTVTTGSYSDVTTTSATLFGDTTYVDNGLAVREDFEWGIDTTPLSDSGGRITWITSTPDSSKAEIDTAYDYEGTRSGRLYRDGSNNPRAYFAHSAMGTTETFSVRVRKDSTSQVGFYHGNGAKVINCGVHSDE
ncbi:MAG: DNRLRE domain-containing protein, partial [Candidatus Aenigmarchaeota archaeon]|nr:DNRLRE domain-containing protein [Candidatus Aenigmarchaeota archaeon]